MPSKEISMKKIKTILRLYFESQLSQDQIAASLELSKGVVNKYLKKALLTGVSWPLPEEWDDEVLYQRLHGHALAADQKAASTPAPVDFSVICQELKSKGVTLQLLWEEQKAAQPAFMSYPHFCLLYRK